jgi:integrase
LIVRQAARELDPVRRWIPLLCAYSGARIAEICQLRGEDIFQHDGLWCLKIVPEAGSLKTVGSERVVPLHAAVIEAGFLEFVAAQRAGPLFPGLAVDRFGARSANGTRIIGRWVRGLGITDVRISPSHSWRHRFKTLGRRYGLALDLVNALTGHHRKTVADSYGEFPIESLYRELSKIPSVGITE